MKKVILQISGMDCAACAVNIEFFLKKEKAIKNASVNYASRKALIEYDETKISFLQIKNIIQKIGYKVVDDTLKDVDEKQSRKNLFIRFILNFIFGIPVIYIAMSEMFFLPLNDFLIKNSVLIQLFFSSLIIISSFEIWKSGIKKIINFAPNMDSLIFIGTSAAYFYSLFQFFYSYINKSQINILYFESAVFILIFITLGKFLESITKEKTNLAIKKLINASPKEATILEKEDDDVGVKVGIDKLIVGSFILVKPGEQIPVDGIIVRGHSTIDQKMLTGESLPIEKQVGDQVLSGTINLSSFLVIKALKVGLDTVLFKVISITEEAMNSKVPLQLLVDKISFYFVPTVLFIAIISGSVWLFLGFPFSFSLQVFISVLIIACPCALGLATPVVVMMGSSIAAKNGILIKSNRAVDIASKANAIIFDKTGTLTEGDIKVDQILGQKQDEILSLAASVENKSEHPLAVAIVNEANNRNLKMLKVKDFINIPGVGVEAHIFDKENNIINVKVGGKKILVGKKDFSFDKKSTLVFVIKNDEVLGQITFRDKIKQTAFETMHVLRKRDMQLLMLTGDNEIIAKDIANQLNINYLADVLPDEKYREIQRMKSNGLVVIMVGDGVNDAPALAGADLGVAIGRGTDIAIEAGDIVLLNKDLKSLIIVLDLSKYIIKKIKQNLFWAFSYNIVMIPIAAGILYPFFKILLSPTIAAGAMVFSSLSVILNALFMKNWKSEVIRKNQIKK